MGWIHYILAKTKPEWLKHEWKFALILDAFFIVAMTYIGLKIQPVIVERCSIDFGNISAFNFTASNFSLP